MGLHQGFDVGLLKSKAEGSRSKNVAASLGFLQFILLLTLYLSVEKVTGTVPISPTSTASSDDILHLALAKSCGTTATLEWALEGNTEVYTEKCELTYYPTDSESAVILSIYLEAVAPLIHLFNLSEGESYTTVLVCRGYLATNKVSFIAGGQCGETHHLSAPHSHNETHVDNSVVSSYSGSTKHNSLEWPLAITFVAVGIITFSVVAFYMWKRYQRRQRILRIFRQGQNDPFQALYSPTQDSYSF